jgi:hypothetical protein
MFIIALFVYRVAATHEDHSLRRRKHVLSTDRAVAVRAPLYALVRGGHGYTHTQPAGLAVKEVLSQPPADSAYAAVCTVVYRLVRVVLPEVTDIAVVVCGFHTAVLARI